MKKLLLASTALVMSAGFASAQVTLSGDARMGLIYNGDDVQMTSRARVTFTLSGETDTGLAFGASFRADNAPSAAGNTRMTAGTVFISGDFGKLTMGDVDTAARAAVGDLYGVGLTGLGDLNEVAYLDRLGFGGAYTGQAYETAALYEYSIDGFTGYIGLGQNNVVRTPAFTDRDNLVSVGAKYTLDGFTGAIGYEYSRARGTGLPSFTASHLVASVEYAMDGFKGKVFAGRAGSDLGDALSLIGASKSHYGLSVEGSFDATTVTAFVYRDNFKNTQAGIGGAYDLGGGASIKGGIVREDFGATRQTRADFGLAFRF
ncbi:MAG: porin [Roseinatronobacter sp.]